MTADSDQNTAHAQAEANGADADLSPEQCHAEAERLVRKYTFGGMSVGLVPIPLVDLAALVAVQLKMLHGLAGLYGIDFKADLVRPAIGSLVGGLLPTALSPSLAASLGKLIPGAGQVLGAGTQVAVNGAATYALGKVFIQHFAAGGTFLTFDPEVVRGYFEAQLKEGRQVAEELKPKGRRRAAAKQPETGAS